MRRFGAQWVAGVTTFGLLHCGGCEDPEVVRLQPTVSIEPSTIDLGDLPLGVRGQGTVTVQNIGTQVLRLSSYRVEGHPAFSMLPNQPESLRLGESAPVTVQAQATELGAKTATLLFETNDPDTPVARLPLKLRGVPVPPCDDNNVCTADSFNAEENACIHSFADGIPCEALDRCIINASCQKGVCLGEPKVCDDKSPCTRDLCRQIDGRCIFLEDEEACDDNNPCTVDGCTEQGCTNEAKLNGQPCTDEDECTLKDACFAGRCVGTDALDGSPCDDGDSCTTSDRCQEGVCVGESMTTARAEGEVVFEYPLSAWQGTAFLHRREVSLGEDGTFFGLDHLEFDGGGFTHVVSAMQKCGTELYQFAYRPPDLQVTVWNVWRQMQLGVENDLRVAVGVRHLPENGFRPETTTYLLDRDGNPERSEIQVLGAEVGRSLLPDGSHIYGILWPISQGIPSFENPPLQNLIIVREDVGGNVLWRHERASGPTAQFLGVAGPRVLFWANDRFGALDFNTGAPVWSAPTRFVSDEMALSTSLNLGVIRTRAQIIGFEVLEGAQVFAFPERPDPLYVPRTDPVISRDGRILFLMQRNLEDETPLGLEWVELNPDGRPRDPTPAALPYTFPPDPDDARAEDVSADPYPTVALDGVTYVGYGDQFWAIRPGGELAWTLSSTIANAFTGTVPLLRTDGIMLISRGARTIIGVRTNDAQMSPEGWASFRHGGRRTNFTP